MDAKKQFASGRTTSVAACFHGGRRPTVQLGVSLIDALADVRSCRPVPSRAEFVRIEGLIYGVDAAKAAIEGGKSKALTLAEVN